jgi:hypothetical protein
VKKHHDKRARDLPFLKCGQNVYFEHKAGDQWILGKITDILGDYTYVVQAQNGTKYRRNRVSIRPIQVQAIIRDCSPIRTQIKRQPEVVKPSTAYNTSATHEYNDEGQTHEDQSSNSKMETSVVTNPRSQGVSSPIPDKQTRNERVSTTARVQPSRNWKPPAYLSDYVRP